MKGEDHAAHLAPRSRGEYTAALGLGRGRNRGSRDARCEMKKRRRLALAALLNLLLPRMSCGFLRSTTGETRRKEGM